MNSIESGKMRDSIAMLKLVSMSTKSMLEGKSQTVKQAFSDIRKRVKESTDK